MKLYKIIDVSYLKDHYKNDNDLYLTWLLYSDLLFNEFCLYNKYDVYKSKLYYDDEKCFDGELFIVVTNIHKCQIKKHYELKYCLLFSNV